MSICNGLVVVWTIFGWSRKKKGVSAVEVKQEYLNVEVVFGHEFQMEMFWRFVSKNHYFTWNTPRTNFWKSDLKQTLICKSCMSKHLLSFCLCFILFWVLLRFEHQKESMALCWLDVFGTTLALNIRFFWCRNTCTLEVTFRVCINSLMW